MQPLSPSPDRDPLDALAPGSEFRAAVPPPHEACPSDSPAGRDGSLFSPAVLAPPPVPRSPRAIGPGLWESLAWLAGMHIVQGIAALLVICALAAVHLFANPIAFPTGPDQKFNLQEHFRGIGPAIERELATIIGLAGLATVVYSALAVSLRQQRAGGLRGLGFQLPSMGHIALVALAMVPLSLLCTELQKYMFRLVPHAENDLSRLFSHLTDAPIGVLILAMAVAPALGEELLFRGLIGRGLISRMGVVRGVLVTSVLFGLMHVNPAQSIAVIPLGIAMHFAYLTTRSFWAPIQLHFMNNAFAAVLMKYGDQFPPMRLLDAEQPAPLPLLTVSAAMVLAIGMLLWQTRVQYTRLDGTLLPGNWTPDGLAHSEVQAVPVIPPPQPLLVACGAFNSLGFLAVIYRLAIAL